MSQIILTQTDTTVGFLSQNSKNLYEIKSRSATKPFIKVYSNFKSFLESGNRVSNSNKKLVRRAKKTTFIVKNRAFRVAATTLNSQILRDSSWHYSTSANKSNESFNREFCESKADIIIEDVNGLVEKSSSALIKINRNKRIKLR
ncbi:Sua5/YciO/YrdC/YwlC family protein [Sulfurimonas sp.]|uniref:Sua5/YciO/YrdC/YwlC family protein n=1 Tax=Sulfurimonas sp. TaxID=2022749 RepID=UPI002615C292|nr:Sua5/YciO/YrdC/YwlC family protein [Sulfurimonas sp.]MCW8895367.1 Sua5/YciO/YrdC/YwlC family protein [Sulfurimonas sp.]MCW9067510.1 Sua5/YciO/YrdC/YwlC family protein [Sulfurimonas sp.]